MAPPDNKRVLAIFAHSDDELSCAGTLANHADAGDHVYLAFLTKGENSTTVAGDREEKIAKRKEHTRKIEQLLGVTIRYLDFPDSRIEYNVENGYIIAELIREIRPHIIITWSEFERTGAGHPDHRNTARLVYDAINYARYINHNSKFEPYREPISFYRYYNPDKADKNKIQFIDVTHQEEKIRKFIEIYKEAYGEWPVEHFKFTSMQYYGARRGGKLIEAFEVIFREEEIPKLLF